MHNRIILLLLAGFILSAGRLDDDYGVTDADREDPATSIRVPAGFRAEIVADDLGRARHMVVTDKGTIFVSLRSRNGAGHGIVRLRDADGDGNYEDQSSFMRDAGTGLGLYDGHLYFSNDTQIFRMALDDDDQPGTPELIVGGFDQQRQHATKPMTFDDDGNMYVAIGGPSNACQKAARTKGSPGLTPCPQLARQAGIWLFDATKPGQRHGQDGRRYATGIRNALALDYDPASDQVFFSSHGRDQLSYLFPDLYSDEDNAALPSEEFHRAVDGGDYGWPYTYWDHREKKRMLAPEYGGDGTQATPRGQYRVPMAAIPGHWAPNDLVIYHGDQFPAKYQGGAFIAFHGSWNRAPLPQDGYNVVFVPMSKGRIKHRWRVFADKFKGAETLASPRAAEYRPMGLAVGPDGSLYVADSVKGRVWRIRYEG